MFVYLGIYLLLVLTGSGKNAAGNRAALLFWTLFLILFAGTREWIGCDFGGYLNRFENFEDRTFEQVMEKSERLFSLIMLAIVAADLDYMWLNVVVSLIIFACYYAFAVRFEKPVHFLALAFPILILQLSMSGIRQAAALAILLLALNAFRDNKRVAMVFWIVVASQFHTSAIIFMPLVLMVGRNPKLTTMIGATLAVAPVAIFLAGDRVETYDARYGGGEVESFGAVFRTALVAISAVFFEVYRKTYERLYPGDYPLMRIFSIMTFLVVVVLFVSSIAAHRLGFYMMPVHIIMLLRLPRVMSARSPDVLLAAMPFIAYGLYITVWFATSRHATVCYVPYNSYLF